mmetsp:Transcript_65046/g.153045  ORF Transcript_65046/g.153045 Transcript_65046/m.153045 type:complete len:328 (-) Transcript_65046:288-1271(-)
MVAQPVAPSWTARQRTRCTLAPSSLEGPSRTSSVSPTSKRRTVLDLMQMSSESTVPFTHLKYRRMSSKKLAWSSSPDPATSLKSRSDVGASSSMPTALRRAIKASSWMASPALQDSKISSPVLPSVVIRARIAVAVRPRSSRTSRWAFLATSSLDALALLRTRSICTSRMRCCSCKRKTSFFRWGSLGTSSSWLAAVSNILRTSSACNSARSAPDAVASDASASKALNSSATWFNLSLASSNWEEIFSMISWTSWRFASACLFCSSSSARLLRVSVSYLAMPTFWRRDINLSKVTGSSTRMMRSRIVSGNSTVCSALPYASTSERLS